MKDTPRMRVWTPGRLGGVGHGAGQARKDTGLIKATTLNYK